MLGMGCGCLAGALELHLTQVGARGNAFRALVFAYTPKWLKNQGGIPHFDLLQRNYPFFLERAASRRSKARLYTVKQIYEELTA